MLINHEHMLNSQLFELNSISEVNNIETNSTINIKLKQDDISVNKLFANLYEYAKDPLFIKIMNIIEVEHRKYLNKYLSKYVNKHINNRTQKYNKNLKQTMRKLLTHKRKPSESPNIENYMLTNLKMMIYDYNI
jgi:hypothetical protein